jgi:hypothetical protein
MLFNVCQAVLGNTEFSADRRQKTALGFLYNCIEHWKAITCLARDEIFGSAYALARSQLEAYIRGVFFHRCATEEEVDAFQKGQKPSIERMVNRIDKQREGQEQGRMSRLYADHWGQFCDFTHNGPVSVFVRYAGNSLTSGIPSEQVSSLVDATARIGWMACLASTEVMRREALWTKLIAFNDEIMNVETLTG